MMSSRQIIIDREALRRFQNKTYQTVAIPEVLMEAYRLIGADLGLTGHEKPQSTQDPKGIRGIKHVYQDAQGVVFSWGHILERRINQYVIWDYCLIPLLNRYLGRGLHLSHLQQQVFTVIEKHVNRTTRDVISTVAITEGWTFCPGTAISAVTQVVHFTAEREARDWTAERLLEQVLPNAIAKAREFADRNGH